jgi:hypothetical protein
MQASSGIAVGGTGGPPPPRKPTGTGPPSYAAAASAPAKAVAKPSPASFKAAQKAQSSSSGPVSGDSASPAAVASAAPGAAKRIRQKASKAVAASQAASAPKMKMGAKPASSSSVSAADHKSALSDGKEAANPAAGFFKPLIIPDNLSFLTGAQQAKLQTVVRGLGVLDNFCQRNIPGAREMAVQDLTTSIGKINDNLLVGDSRISCFLGSINGHIQEAVIAAQFEQNGETVSEFSHIIPNSEVDVVSSTPDGQTIYNQIKSGRAIPDLSLDRGPEFVTQMNRTILAAINDDVPFVRLVGPNLSQPMIDHMTALQTAINEVDTALRAAGPAPAKPANLSQEIFNAIQAKAASGEPLQISLSSLILG